MDWGKDFSEEEAVEASQMIGVFKRLESTGELFKNKEIKNFISSPVFDAETLAEQEPSNYTHTFELSSLGFLNPSTEKDFVFTVSGKFSDEMHTKLLKEQSSGLSPKTAATLFYIVTVWTALALLAYPAMVEKGLEIHFFAMVAGISTTILGMVRMFMGGFLKFLARIVLFSAKAREKDG